MRGQAEVISTAILVSVAVVVALGLIYYLEPQLAASSRDYQVSSLLSSYAASLQVTELSRVNTTGGVVEAFELSNLGPRPFRIYVGVVPFLNSTGIPVSGGGGNYTAYVMVNESAVVAPGNTTGWAVLPSVNVSPLSLWIYVGSKYYRISDLGWNGSVLLYDLGVLNVSKPLVIKVDISDMSTDIVYYVSFFARIGNQYYEVSRVIVYQS